MTQVPWCDAVEGGRPPVFCGDPPGVPGPGSNLTCYNNDTVHHVNAAIRKTLLCGFKEFMRSQVGS